VWLPVENMSLLFWLEGLEYPDPTAITSTEKHTYEALSQVVPVWGRRCTNNSLTTTDFEG